MDASPLLPPSSPRADPKPRTLPGSIDAAVEKFIAGSSSHALASQAILAVSAMLFDAQQSLVSIFSDAPAPWHCTGGSAVCPGGSETGGQCSLPATSWSWDRPSHSSIVSEWSTDCISPSVKGFPASAFFLGCFAGGLVLAALADTTLGRKKMLFLSCLSMGLAGVLTAFSPNIWVYTAMRFVTGFCRSTINTIAIVLSTEIVGKRWCDQVCIAGFFLYTLGYLSLPVMAYVGRDWSWRALYLMISVPCLLYSVLLYFIGKDSPRWLLVMGRKEEAILTLKSLRAWNGDYKDENTNGHDLDWYEGGMDIGGKKVAGLFSTLKVLAKSRWALKRLVAVMVLGFGLQMGYLGMPLGVGNLGSNLYLVVAFNALAELPSTLLVFIFVGRRMRRRSSLFWLTVVSGTCSLACAALDREMLRVGAEVAAFFTACSAVSLLFIYLVELFPTCVRSTAVSMVRQALALGGVLAPALVAAGTGTGARFLPYGAFGLIIGCCSFSVLFLRETRGEGICDTMEEQEHSDSIPSVGLDNGGKCLP